MRKLLTLLLCTLLLAGLTACGEKELVESIDENIMTKTYKLEIVEELPEILTIPNATSSFLYWRVNEYEDKEEPLKYSAWSIELDAAAVEESPYVADSSIDVTNTQDVILNYSLNYKNHDLYGTLAGYYAVQVAIWGRINKEDPLTLELGTEVSSDLATRVRDFAHELYIGSVDYAPTSIVMADGNQIITGSGDYDLGAIDGGDYLYQISKKLYWKSPLLCVYNSHEYSKTKSEIDVSSIPGAIIADTDYKPMNLTDGKATIGDGTETGSFFYVFIPATEGTVTSGTITVNTEISYLGVIGWNGGESQKLASLWDECDSTSNSISMTWRILQKK